MEDVTIRYVVLCIWFPLSDVSNSFTARKETDMLCLENRAVEPRISLEIYIPSSYDSLMLNDES